MPLVYSVPGLVTGELEALPATQRTVRFTEDHTSQQVSHPRRGRVPRDELGTWGRPGGQPRFCAVWSGPRTGGTHAHGWVLPLGVWPVSPLGGQEPFFFFLFFFFCYLYKYFILFIIF